MTQKERLALAQFFWSTATGAGSKAEEPLGAGLARALDGIVSQARTAFFALMGIGVWSCKLADLSTENPSPSVVTAMRAWDPNG